MPGSWAGWLPDWGFKVPKQKTALGGRTDTWVAWTPQATVPTPKTVTQHNAGTIYYKYTRNIVTAKNYIQIM